MDEKLYKAEEKNKLQHQGSWLPLAVIGTGVVLLFANLFMVNPMSFLWPGFVIVPGLLLLWPSAQSTAVRQHPLSFLAVLGALLTAVGVLLFAMNLTDHFEAWAYCWTVVPMSVAAGLMYIKRFDPTHRVHENGRKFIRLFTFIWVGLAIFFELIIFGTFQPWMPLVLIVGGLYLLLHERRQAAKAA